MRPGYVVSQRARKALPYEEEEKREKEREGEEIHPLRQQQKKAANERRFRLRKEGREEGKKGRREGEKGRKILSPGWASLGLRRRRKNIQ